MPDAENLEVWFRIPKDADGYPKTREWEGLLCVKQEEGYRIASVPFYVNEVAYGDIVCASPAPEGFLRYERVVERGGYSVYRLLLADDREADAVVDELVEMDCLVERDGRFVALAVSSGDRQDRVVDFIISGKSSGRWGAQDGYIAEGADP